MKIKHLHLLKYILDGWSIEEIHSKTGIPISYIKRNFKKYFPPEPDYILGSRQETYFTEEDLLTPSVYAYHTLSDSEKEIYNNLSGEV